MALRFERTAETIMRDCDPDPRDKTSQTTGTY